VNVASDLCILGLHRIPIENITITELTHPAQPWRYWIYYLLYTCTTLSPTWLLAMHCQCTILFQWNCEKTCTDMFQNNNWSNRSTMYYYLDITFNSTWIHGLTLVEWHGLYVASILVWCQKIIWFQNRLSVLIKMTMIQGPTMSRYLQDQWQFCTP
jgi:hypothetical protein